MPEDEDDVYELFFFFFSKLMDHVALPVTKLIGILCEKQNVTSFMTHSEIYTWERGTAGQVHFRAQAHITWQDFIRSCGHFQQCYDPHDSLILLLYHEPIKQKHAWGPDWSYLPLKISDVRTGSVRHCQREDASLVRPAPWPSLRPGGTMSAKERWDFRIPPQVANTRIAQRTILRRMRLSHLFSKATIEFCLKFMVCLQRSCQKISNFIDLPQEKY